MNKQFSWKAEQPDLQIANMGPKGPQSARSGGGESKCTLQAYKDRGEK